MIDPPPGWPTDTSSSERLVWGGRYELSTVPGDAAFVMTDSNDRPVAGLLHDGSGWETADQWCDTAIEHTRMGWALAVRSGSTRKVLARASPRWRPAAYALRLENGKSFRLGRVPFTSRWVLRLGRNRIAQINIRREFLADQQPTSAGHEPVATVELERDGRGVPGRPDLPVLLALQVIRVGASVPAVDAGGGAGP